MQRLNAKRWNLDAMSHPLFWVALISLLVNDNWLKGHGPAWLTGKLSDFAFLVVAPCVLVAVLPTAWVRLRRAAFLFPFFVIAAVDLSPAISDAFVAAAGVVGLHWRLWPDVTDLLALLVLPVTARIVGVGASTTRAPVPSVQACGVIIGTWACIATSAPPEYSANTLLANRTGQSITVRLSPLAYDSSCTNISEDATKLTLGDVHSPRTYTLAAGELLEIKTEDGEPPAGVYNCGGASYQGDGCEVLYVEVEGLPGALVAGQVWDYDSNEDTCDRRLKPASRPLRGYLDVVKSGANLALQPGEGLAVATLDRDTLQARPVSPGSCAGIATDYLKAIEQSTATCDVDSDCVGVIGFTTATTQSCSVYFNKQAVAATLAPGLTDAWANKQCRGATPCTPTAPALCIEGKCRAGCTNNPALPLCPGSVATPDCPFTCYSPPRNPLEPYRPPYTPPDASPFSPSLDAAVPPDACSYTGIASSLCPR